jgi:hypothetical protein
MNTFKLTMKLTNAAFAGMNQPYEIARILREVAQKVENEEEISTILDINGNCVGKVEIK